MIYVPVLYSTRFEINIEFISIRSVYPCREAARFYVGNTLLKVRINTSDDYQVIVVWLRFNLI